MYFISLILYVWSLLISSLQLFCLAFILRFFYLIYKVRRGDTRYCHDEDNHSDVYTVICIGSGGHTTEMISLLLSLDPKVYVPRYYIMADDDQTSESKILALEADVFKTGAFHILRIPRSRVVHQSYLSSVFTTIRAILFTIPMMYQLKPELIICNGPGTCIPICLTAFFMKVLFLCQTRIVFVESICRANTFSLTGKILQNFADNIVVQWESLADTYKRADYLGKLI